MTTVQDIIWNLCCIIRFFRLLIWYARIFLVAILSPKAKMAARLLVSGSQLAIYKHRISHKKEPRPTFIPAFRFLWILLSRYRSSWCFGAHLIQPATVLKWRRQGFRFYWRWKSRKRGRPKVDAEMRRHIKQTSTENRLWTAERIHDVASGSRLVKTRWSITLHEFFILQRAVNTAHLDHYTPT